MNPLAHPFASIAPASQMRQLNGADAEAFQALRLEALERHPAAFAASHLEEAGHCLAEVARRLDQGAVFGAFVEGLLTGSAGFARPERIKKCHKGVLWGVYVRAPVRGQGLGRGLVEQVIDHARGRVEQLHATVTTSNQAAPPALPRPRLPDLRSRAARPQGRRPVLRPGADGPLTPGMR